MSKSTYIKDLFRAVIFSCFARQLVAKHIRKTGLRHNLLTGGTLEEALKEACQTHLPEHIQEQPELMKSLHDDIVASYLFCKASPSEYFEFNFKQKSFWERSKYLTDITKFKVCFKKIGEKAFWEDLKDKWNFYSLLKPYFHRDACKVSSVEDWTAYNDFVTRHPLYFQKPINATLGQGCRIENTVGRDARAIFDELITSGTGWILEEVVQQDEQMARWNDTSVNTIRVHSFRVNNKIYFLNSILRVGRKGAVVDNHGAGGLIAEIDNETGTVITPGYDKKCHLYHQHPDSGCSIEGEQIPRWNELIKLAEEAHLALPSYHRYVAWDMALSKTGWVLIEGNWGQFTTLQITSRRGYKKDFLQFMHD